MARRFVVMGASGNGKTTVGRALARRFELPYLELDSLNHGPNWTEASDEELRTGILEFVDGNPDGWVVDGNYHRKIGDLVLERADTAVWLDQGLPLILGRLWRRTLARIRRREELWNGNRESWRSAFWTRESLFAWTVRSHFRHRRTFPERFARHPSVELVRLRSPAELEQWLARL